MSCGKGALVLYHDRSAAIESVSGDKLEIRIEGGERKNVRPKDVEFLHPGPVTVLPPPVPPEPDWQEIVELLDGESLSFADFVNLAYGEYTPGSAFAGYRMLRDSVYFNGSPAAGVTPRSEEEIAARLAAQQSKAAERDRRAALIERIRSGAVEAGDLPFLREVEAVALGRAPNSRLMRDLGIEAVPEKAHELLLRLKVWTLLRDPWPSRLGVDIAPPAGELPPTRPEKREDYTFMRSLAIDDAGSDDPDDAISFHDGLLYVHVADPAAALEFGDEVDTEAAQRGSSSYLPEGVTPMLPAEATRRFGLGLQETSPALSFGIRIDDDGEATLEQLALSTIRAERLDYDGCADRWDESPLREIRATLERFRRRRETAGALFIRLPEIKLRISGEEVTIAPCPITPERELVANAMLAAGHAAAKYMAERGWLFPFVTQEPPDTDERGESLPAMFALRRHSAPGVPSLSPGRHSGLGLEPYARVTSPLRRYADLLAHYQLRRVLSGAEPLGFDELSERLALAEAGAAERRRLEKYANEYYTLVYLTEHPEWEGDGVVVDRQGERLTILIPELAYEYKCRLRGNYPVGSSWRLKLNSADPATLRSSLRLTEELE